MTTSIHDILAELRTISYDERDKGDRFERLMLSYLQLEPQYEQLYSDVWMWKDYPARNGRKDTGIDIVSRARDTGELTAIQCKFYAPNHTLGKPDIDSFLAASSKTEFSARLIISTTDNWGPNAEEAVENQSPPVARLRVQDLDDSAIDWAQFSIEMPGFLTKKAPKQPYPHQETAISKVLAGFENADRGKLIMACGTGKTFTSLKLAEKLVPAGGTVLFLVPSISLLSQTLKEWTIEAAVPLRSFAVCSDVSVGKRKNEEDIPVTDLAYPATTNTPKLLQKFSEIPADFEGLTVIFSTYQSIDVVAQAQALGLPEFDLIVCDEAHRTTGVTLADEDESTFVRVHNQSYIKATKRLYMTATPRIYADASRSKAEEVGAVLTDMNNTDLFGEEFHRLGFGEAVSIGRLTDYKVLVLAVDETYISNRFQRMLADDDNQMKLEDAAKIVGCWNGLSKRALTAEEFALDPEPMKRAVAFARNIKESKKIAEMFQLVVDSEIEALDEDSDGLLRTEVHHVDGTFNVLKRNQELDWLKEEPGDGNARILTNAKCLSEGVDVPALDAVMFLNPRDSVVDVVQSVGRVMRKLDGKKYGYVILPIAVPGDVEPEVALADNKKYKVVWQVLQALRAHDERFDAMVNKIDLTKSTEDKLSIIGVGGKSKDDEEDWGNVTLDFPNIDQWRDAILAKIVQKVGERRYWENWAKDVAGIASDHMTRIRTLVDGSDSKLHEEFTTFTQGLKDNLNPYITEHDAIEMLSQHLITKPVFDALFEGYAFSESNPVSRVMQVMIDVLEGENLGKETEKLNKFYDSVRTRAAGITDAAAKQGIVKELYEKFFKTAFSGTSDRLGIVYTPNAIVDFILHSVDDALKDQFGTSVSDEGVHILDPFTGTGTFIVRLLQSGLIKPEDLEHKYRYELHANELVLLAYYVAAINIEETYHSLAGGDYLPFDGIVLTDTFQMDESDDADELDGTAVFPENNDRVKAQKSSDIRVIVGNPPYSAKQGSGNEDNQNLKYPTLDARIAKTYLTRSTATNKAALYDSYIRSLRWASDRIGDRGIVAFVSNGSFVETPTTDGVRKALIEEFSSIYVLNLRGNQRGDWRKEGGKVFGEGSQSSIAIYLLIKNPEDSTWGKVFYHGVADFQTREQKLDGLKSAHSYRGLQWTPVMPNSAGDWINQRNVEFQAFTPIGSKERDSRGGLKVFTTYSAGLKTNRDAWVYNFSKAEVERNLTRMVASYNAQVDSSKSAKSKGEPWTRDNDPTKLSWDTPLGNALENGRYLSHDQAELIPAAYRPFSKHWVAFGRLIDNSVHLLPQMFPSSRTENFGFYISGIGATKPFSILMVGSIPDVNTWGSEGGQFFPRFTYETRTPSGDLFDAFDAVDESPYRKVDNVTDEILADYQKSFGLDVTKDDIFHYVYGLLHSLDYRQRFESDLRKMIPRVPKSKAFRSFAEAGRKLSRLHLGYETVDPYPLNEERSADADYKVTKMRHPGMGAKKDNTTVIFNSDVTITGIPEVAYEYMLGSRPAVDWIIERYQLKTDKPSGIVNDPNDWAAEHENPRYVLDLLARIVTVSVETVKIVKSLPSLEVLGD
ncbi:DEAD/DEAH box helicase family protein [Cryobacterium sp. RTS3]|uniref:DEAD/DEAH box helicase n=1 Tax=Cryobacterium sp. RTS3 TaxID=3048643 RepID=UPI002B23E6BF|nr:type ISP restriction/modification enzyme [Cryobacterium sp. RTS3]MEB0000529.1 DEAD/DEAH box helicase family protein [Cryobacterium sp. RTS3]